MPLKRRVSYHHLRESAHCVRECHVTQLRAAKCSLQECSLCYLLQINPRHFHSTCAGLCPQRGVLSSRCLHVSWSGNPAWPSSGDSYSLPCWCSLISSYFQSPSLSSEQLPSPSAPLSMVEVLKREHPSLCSALVLTQATLSSSGRDKSLMEPLPAHQSPIL